MSEERFGSHEGGASNLYRRLHGEVTVRVSNKRRRFFISSGPVRIYEITEKGHYGVKHANGFSRTPSFNFYTSRGACCFNCGLRTLYKLDKIVRSCSLSGTDMTSLRCVGSMGRACRSYDVCNSGKCVKTSMRLSLFRATRVELRYPCQLGRGS